MFFDESESSSASALKQISRREHPYNNTLTTIILTLSGMISFNGDTNSVLPFSCSAVPVEFLGVFAEHCLFCLLVITTQLLFRRRTSWRQHTENLALSISWISIF